MSYIYMHMIWTLPFLPFLTAFWKDPRYTDCLVQRKSHWWGAYLPSVQFYPFIWKYMSIYGNLRFLGVIIVILLFQVVFHFIFMSENACVVNNCCLFSWLRFIWDLLDTFLNVFFYLLTEAGCGNNFLFICCSLKIMSLEEHFNCEACGTLSGKI